MNKNYKKFFKWFNPQYYQFLILATGPQTKDVIEKIQSLARNDWKESIGKCIEFKFKGPMSKDYCNCIFRCEGIDLDTSRKQPVLKGMLLSSGVGKKTYTELMKNYAIPFNTIETGFCYDIKEISSDKFKSELEQLTK